MDQSDYENSITSLCLNFYENEYSADYDITFIEFIELCGLFFNNQL